MSDVDEKLKALTRQIENDTQWITIKWRYDRWQVDMEATINPHGLLHQELVVSIDRLFVEQASCVEMVPFLKNQLRMSITSFYGL